MSRSSFYEFGPFLVDASRRVLLRDGEAVPLAPKAFDTLLALVQNHGQVLEKNKLMEMLWPDSDVEEGNLPQHISALRKALGESPNDRRYIVTIPGRGYRFAADVAESDGQEVVAERHTRATIVIHEQQSELDEAARAPSPSPLLSGRLRAILGGLAILAVVIFLATRLWRPVKPDTPMPPAAIKSLAVLPFRQMGAAGDEYMGLGIADSLITKLSNLRGIKVRPTSAVLKYSDKSIDPAEIGRNLGVEAVLEGSIRRDGENLSVTVQLVRVQDGSPLWADKFDDVFTSIFKIEDSISARVGESLLTRLAGEEREALAKRYTENTEAYQFYLKGRYYLSKSTPNAINRGIENFKQAIEKDPNYALAYAGLADCYLTVPSTDARPIEAFQKSREAAARALEIDDRLGEAYAARGTISFWFDWNWAEAESDLKRAVDISPNQALAHFRYAHLLSNLGRHEEAVAEARRALELDPLSLLINSVVAQFFYHMREYDQATDQARKAVELDQDFWIAHGVLGRVYTEKRMYSQAIAELEKAVQLSGGTTESYSQLGYAYAVSGNREQARKVLDEMNRISKQKYVPLNNLARIYAGLGENDKALELLERAIDDRETGLTYLKVVPQWDAIRQEPRFRQILQRIGLAE
ncbi:MAG TPA: tetratricopeptide repeat protein [Blastocatellia bacterium]|nr:tetratricopeptide repeat protein [Blastocatellia bacterium]